MWAAVPRRSTHHPTLGALPLRSHLHGIEQPREHIRDVDQLRRRVRGARDEDRPARVTQGAGDPVAESVRTGHLVRRTGRRWTPAAGRRRCRGTPARRRPWLRRTARGKPRRDRSPAAPVRSRRRRERLDHQLQIVDHRRPTRSGSRGPFMPACHDEIADAQAPTGDDRRAQTARTPLRGLGGLAGRPIQATQ